MTENTNDSQKLNEIQQFLENSELKIFRNYDNVDIIGLCSHINKKMFNITFPMYINFKHNFYETGNDDNNVIQLIPYLHLEIAGSISAPFRYKDFMTHYYPNENIIQEYFSFVKKIIQVLSETDEKETANTSQNNIVKFH